MIIGARLVAKLCYLIWTFELVNVYLSILLNLILFFGKTDTKDWLSALNTTQAHSPLPLPASGATPSSLHVRSQSAPESEPSCLASEVWRLVCLRLSCRRCLHSSSEQKPGLVLSFTKVSRWGNGRKQNVSFMSQTFSLMLQFFLRPSHEWSNYCLLYDNILLSDEKTAHLHFIMIFRAVEFVNFPNKGGIMSHKAANSESDSIPLGSEPR